MTDGVLLEGVRNNGLTSYAGQLRVRGFDREQILSALREANKERCWPPLPDSELRNIAKSAAKWPAHPNGQRLYSAFVPKACFDPRISICGFDAVDIVRTDTTLGLRERHKDGYGVLVGFFGSYGCHPSQETIADALGVFQQQVSRDVKRLVRAGLILTEPGAYRKKDRKHGATTYHFYRHHLFAEHFTQRGLPVFMNLANFSQQLGEDTVTAGSFGLLSRASLLRAPNSQQDSADLTTQSVVVEPISALVSRTNLVIPPEPRGYWITRFIECASGCGGSRIEYGDGTVKCFECSCGVLAYLEMAA
jgi:hypothetical protein